MIHLYKNLFLVEYMRKLGLAHIGFQRTKLSFYMIMAAMDSNSGLEEFSFIIDKAKEYGVKVKELKKLEEKAEKISKRFTFTKERSIRAEMAKDLARMILMDQSVHQDEIKYGQKLCKSLGFGEDYFEGLLQSEKKEVKCVEKQKNIYPLKDLDLNYAMREWLHMFMGFNKCFELNIYKPKYSYLTYFSMPENTVGIVDESLGCKVETGKIVNIRELGINIDAILMNTAIDQYTNYYYVLEYPRNIEKSYLDISPGLL